MELQDKTIVVLGDFDEIYTLGKMYKERYPQGTWLGERDVSFDYLRRKHAKTPLAIRIDDEICGYADAEFYKEALEYNSYRIINMHCLLQPKIDDAAFFAMLEGEWQ